MLTKTDLFGTLNSGISGLQNIHQDENSDRKASILKLYIGFSSEDVRSNIFQKGVTWRFNKPSLCGGI